MRAKRKPAAAKEVLVAVRNRVQQAKHPAFAADADNVVVGWNSDLERLLGVTQREALGKPLAEVLEARDAFGNRWCAGNCGIHAMVRRGDPVHGFALDVKNSFGDPMRLFASIEVLPGSGKGKYHVLFSLRPDRRRRDTIFAKGNHQANNSGAVDLANRDTRAVDLTHRQTQVLGRLAEGQSTHVIATELGISLNTVRNHIQNALSKLGAHSQAHAIAVAIRRCLI